MPPKKEEKPKLSAKEQQKKMEKLIADRTFGMKGKKGAKGQKLIQQLTNQVQGNKAQQQQLAAKKKKEEQDDMRDLSKIFKPVQEMPKVAADVDPKSVLCVFFKQGLCTKGKKCKFSHDLAVQQKTAKRNLYVDSRDIKDDEAAETNEDWDESKLQEVAEKKHGAQDRKRPNQTNIVCKYFLDAVETAHYGWFWTCPNGDTCICECIEVVINLFINLDKHALPPGFVLAKDRKKMDEQKRLEQISLDELIEKERANLSTKTLTKVTLESFIAWKKKKIAERRQREAEEDKKKRSQYKTGQKAGVTGREMFVFDPNMNVDEDEEEGGATFVREKPEDNPEEPKAFVIDERTFYNIGEDGKMLDDDLEVNAATAADGESSKVVIDASVFNVDDVENLPDSDDDDESEGDGDGDDGGSKDVESSSRLVKDVDTKLRV